MATYVSTKETANFARLCRLVMDICPDLLRKVLDKYVIPSQLQPTLAKFMNVLLPPPPLPPRLGKTPTPRGRKILNPDQERLLFPGGAASGHVTSNEMDVPLLYILLRNICGIPPHTTGWGCPPNPRDTSLSADIDRIREQRNRMCHSHSTMISDADFQVCFQLCSDAIAAIENTECVGSTTFRDAAKRLKIQHMDPEAIKAYVDAVKKVHGDIDALKKIGTQTYGIIATSLIFSCIELVLFDICIIECLSIFTTESTDHFKLGGNILHIAMAMYLFGATSKHTSNR
jgi:hypothetical protein